MTEYDLIKLLDNINILREDEILEFKEARQSFKTRTIGEYFSALSNEANLRAAPQAFLVFGISDTGEIVGSSYRRESGFPETKSKGLQRLKKEIAEETNNRISFREIYEFDYHGKRIVIFVIPPATRGIPTQWAGAAWAREGESLVPLPLNKIDEIRSQPAADWTKLLVSEASYADLNQVAVDRVREAALLRYGARGSLLDTVEDIELLDKLGITIRGSITNAALMLLGWEESAQLIDGPVPRISWTLYESDGHQRSYEHFGPPFVLGIDAVMSKIRNEKYRQLKEEDGAIPAEIREYDSWTLREIIGNALAHQDYSQGRRVHVDEYPDRIVITNDGGFIPEKIENVLAIGYKPSFYRNPHLCDAMLGAGLLDQNALGIRTMFEHARERRMPLPSFAFPHEQVQVTVLNHEINPTFTSILASHPDLPVATLFALDLLQKREALTEAQMDDLIARGLAVSQAGELYLKAGNRRINAHEEELIHTKPLSLNDVILELLAQRDMNRTDLVRALSADFDEAGDFKQRVYRALKKMESAGMVVGEGSTRARRWRLNSNYDKRAAQAIHSNLNA